MKTVTVTMKGLSPMLISVALPQGCVRGGNETPAAFDERTWRDKVHYNEDGYACIHPAQITRGLVDAAKHIGLKVDGGKGMATWTKHFDRGVSAGDFIPIQPLTKKDKVQGVQLYVPADGRRGGSKRVWRWFPKFTKWSLEPTIIVIDNKITREVFETHLKAAGLYIGIGSMRRGNGGEGGMFECTKFAWTEKD